EREALELLANALYLAFPSEWYEGHPVVIAEAFSCGVPIIASDVGNFSELIRPNVTGFHFESGNAESLANILRRALQNRSVATEMGQNARDEYDRNYSREKSLKQLLDAYESAKCHAERRERRA
ncbi:MAG: glycosyltransferase, partial [Actinomycetota bacterium]|nr:glycosyltransferase [Actinomycetota bacterium]